MWRCDWGVRHLDRALERSIAEVEKPKCKQKLLTSFQTQSIGLGAARSNRLNCFR